MLRNFLFLPFENQPFFGDGILPLQTTCVLPLQTTCVRKKEKLGTKLKKNVQPFSEEKNTNH